MIKINAVVLNVNYLFRVIYNISETRYSVFPIFQCYSSSPSDPHMGQPSKLLKTRICVAYHPVHRAWCANASQEVTPRSLYASISAACHCRWQVKVVWIHDTVWKAGNGQPFYLIKSCLMVTTVCGIHTDIMWDNFDCWEKECFWCQCFACSC